MSSVPGPLTVDVDKLRQVLNALMDQVETSKGRYVDIGRDHYWLLELGAVFAEDLHEPGAQPDDFVVGQISDDVSTIDDLAGDIESGDAVLSPWHDLEHAVGLLRALAWKDLPS